MSRADTFYSTVCHYCFKHKPFQSYNIEDVDHINDDNILKCGGCGMVSYCSKQCQKLDRELHGPICNVLYNIRKNELNNENNQKTKKNLNFFENQNFNNEDEFIEYKRELRQLLTIHLGRNLNIMENKMITFMENCTICHLIHTNLLSCPYCLSVFYCQEHEAEAKKEHYKYCFRYRMSLACYEKHYRDNIQMIQPNYNLGNNLWLNEYKNYLNNKLINNNESKSDNDDDIISINDILSGELNPLPISWRNEEIFLNNEIDDIINFYNFTFDMTIPYTIYFLLSHLPNFDKLSYTSLNLHILGAEFQFEVDPYQKYEILFDLLPNLKNLELYMIGPSLPNELNNMDLVMRLKEENVKKQCQAKLYFSKLTYHEYVNIKKNNNEYQKPNLIIGFNAGLHEHMISPNETWTVTLKLIKELNVPCGFSSYIPEECRADSRTMEEKANCEVTLKPIRNPFRSLRSSREMLSKNRFYARNQYLFACGPVLNENDINIEEVWNDSNIEQDRLLLLR